MAQDSMFLTCRKSEAVCVDWHTLPSISDTSLTLLKMALIFKLLGVHIQIPTSVSLNLLPGTSSMYKLAQMFELVGDFISPELEL